MSTTQPQGTGLADLYSPVAGGLADVEKLLVEELRSVSSTQPSTLPRLHRLGAHLQATQMHGGLKRNVLPRPGIGRVDLRRTVAIDQRVDDLTDNTEDIVPTLDTLENPPAEAIHRFT